MPVTSTAKLVRSGSALVEKEEIALQGECGAKRPKIALFGIFGIQNLGNECTLQAMIDNLRGRLPAAELYCICYDPDDTSRRHALPAIAVSWDPTSGFDLRRFLRGSAKEFRDWFRVYKTLRGTDMVVMTGTGMFTDYNICTPFHYPYHIFKWATAARLAGCKVCFVGVGVGPVYQRLSRFFVKSALARADYRSYRDEVSKARVAELGFQANGDQVFPDLAFSFPKRLLPQAQDGPQQGRTVGLGIMDYWDPHVAGPKVRDSSYAAYLEKTCDFTEWLIGHGYSVRLLQGDARHDADAKRDLRDRLQKRGYKDQDGRILDEDTHTVEELLAQLALTDVVVSPRFHNLILALMLNKPVISISYDPKSDALLEGVGLGKYCQSMNDLDVESLIEQFNDLEKRSAQIKLELQNAVERYRTLLDAQYRLVLQSL